MKKRLKKNDRGVTLIALAVTIIVLLILAGITIATLTGENGIITRANEAKGKTEQAQLEEEVNLKILEKEMNGYKNTSKGMEEYLNEIENVTVEEVAGGTWCVTRGQAEVTVYEDGEVITGKAEIWDGTSSEAPEIKEGNLYIYNGSQLKFLADFVNNNNTLTEEQKTLVIEAGYNESDVVLTEDTIVYLMSDIDLGARQQDGQLISGTAWTPIGKSITFPGTFEGNNHIIKGVYISQTENFAGLFGRANNLKNFTIKDSYIIGGNCMGGIAGLAQNIENCHNENTTMVLQEGEYYAVGGIIGQINGSIKDCTNSGNVIANSNSSTYGNRAGGIVGQTISNVTIDNCINYGDITGVSNNVGGIVAQTFASSTVTNCMNYGKIQGGGSFTGGIVGLSSGDIDKSNNVGELIGNGTYTGGIVGGLDTSCTVSNSYNTGNITGNANYVGGVIGCANPSSTVANCYNEGEISGEGERVGGVVGNASTSSSATNCYNIGKVTGNSRLVAGVVGMTGGNIDNCYNTGEVYGKDSYVGGITGEAYLSTTVTNCSNSGNITSDGSQSVGGIAGNLDSSSTLSYCTNTGNVTGKEAGYVAGIVGLMAHNENRTDSKVEKCYNSGIIEGLDQVGGIVRMGRRIYRIWNRN